jgi:hypothetical protein
MLSTPLTALFRLEIPATRLRSKGQARTRSALEVVSQEREKRKHAPELCATRPGCFLYPALHRLGPRLSPQPILALLSKSPSYFQNLLPVLRALRSRPFWFWLLPLAPLLLSSQQVLILALSTPQGSSYMNSISIMSTSSSVVSRPPCPPHLQRSAPTTWRSRSKSQERAVAKDTGVDPH